MPESCVRLAEPDREGGALRLAYCWAHARRKLHEVFEKDDSPIAGDLDAKIAEQCVLLSNDTERIRRQSNFHWWPERRKRYDTPDDYLDPQSAAS